MQVSGRQQGAGVTGAALEERGFVPMEGQGGADHDGQDLVTNRTQIRGH